MKIQRLETLEQAKALTEAVYEDHGLTHSRPWMNDPHRILALNQGGQVTSFIALEEHRVLGHLAAIRPHFELTIGGEPVCDPGTIEVGLSIVHADARETSVEHQLAAAVFAWAHRAGCSGAVMKCDTRSTAAQRLAEAMGGVPTALWLGGIPQCVESGDGSVGSMGPLSTLGLYVRIHGDGVHPIQAMPEGWWKSAVMAKAGVEGLDAAGDEAETGPTELLVDYCSRRLRAHVFVHSPGADLLERLAATTVWLIGGHMEHISFAMPADSARVREVLPRLGELGLFPAGVLPCWLRGRRDAILMQAAAFPVLDAATVRLRTGLVAGVREAVWTGFLQTRTAATEILGMAGLPSRLRQDERYTS